MLSAESKKLTTFTRAKGFRIKFQNPKLMPILQFLLNFYYNFLLGGAGKEGLCTYLIKVTGRPWLAPLYFRLHKYKFGSTRQIGPVPFKIVLKTVNVSWLVILT